MIGYPAWIEDISKLDNYYSNVSLITTNYDKGQFEKRMKCKESNLTKIHVWYLISVNNEKGFTFWKLFGCSEILSCENDE